VKQGVAADFQASQTGQKRRRRRRGARVAAGAGNVEAEQSRICTRRQTRSTHRTGRRSTSL